MGTMMGGMFKNMGSPRKPLISTGLSRNNRGYSTKNFTFPAAGAA